MDERFTRLSTRGAQASHGWQRVGISTGGFTERSEGRERLRKVGSA